MPVEEEKTVEPEPEADDEPENPNQEYLPAQSFELSRELLQYVFDYIKSYGTALGIMNMATMHGLQ